MNVRCALSKELLKQGRKEYREYVKNKGVRRYTPQTIQQARDKIKADKLAKQTKDLFKLKKKEQVDSLKSLGLSNAAIKKLKYEKDRVEKIIKLSKK